MLVPNRETTSPAAGAAFADAPGAVDAALEELLNPADEAHVDRIWSEAREEIACFVLRPGKRVRPALLLAGYTLAAGRAPTAPVVRFAAALELLHAFMLVHDDVADHAEQRRGGQALHHLLAPGRTGEDLAVVAGDHLFAHALEAMLACGDPRAPRAVAFLLGACRQTAAGQYLDLCLSRAPLREAGLARCLRVAHLKTARYGFVAPLLCGALLGDGDELLLETLGRAGRHAGIAYQLRDDLLGLFGDTNRLGKAGAGDFQEGKRTFPVIAAWTRADPRGRERLERLWESTSKDAEALALARAEVERWGGRAATERAIDRSTRHARRALATLPSRGGVRNRLDALVARLARRIA